MSDRGGPEPRTGRRTAVLGGRQAAADWGGRAGDLFSAAFEWLAARLREEADAARLAPWLAICFGIGILLYFAAPAEPSLLAAIQLLLSAALARASRERPFAFALALLNPSFQMSFAAALALVALYERYVPLMAAPPVPGGGAFAHFSVRAMRWLMLGTATSPFAGLATTAMWRFISTGSRPIACSRISSPCR